MDRGRWGWRLLVTVLMVSVSSGLAVRPARAVAHSDARPTQPRLWLGLSVREAALNMRFGATGVLTWTQQAELTSTAQTANDGYGSAVAVSGDTAVVGAPDTPPWPSPNYGVAYLFARSGSTWTPQVELIDPHSADMQTDAFGTAVAISGTTLAIGAPGADGGLGAVYLYTRSGGAWTPQATLTPADATQPENFATALALSGNTLVVGANYQNNGEGAIYIYVRTGNTWSQQAEFRYPGQVLYAGFGWAVAVSGDTALISTAQAPDAYVYVRQGTTWTPQATLRAPAPGRYFGAAVALSGNTALVSACCLATQVNGLVYVFGRSGITWTLQAALKPPAGTTNFVFGTAVALSGHTAVVGGGGARMFVGAGSTWSAPIQLIPSDRPASLMGEALAVQGPTVLVGATAAPAAAYVFVRSGAAAVNSSDDPASERQPAQFDRDR